MVIRNLICVKTLLSPGEWVFQVFEQKNNLAPIDIFNFTEEARRDTRLLGSQLRVCLLEKMGVQDMDFFISFSKPSDIWCSREADCGLTLLRFAELTAVEQLKFWEGFSKEQFQAAAFNL